jgi:hypothetical protein
MGCGYPPQTKENELQIENKKLIPKDDKNNKDISLILYKKIEKFIKLNPFYKIKIFEFEDFLNSVKNSDINDNNKINDSIITTFFEKEESFVKTLFIKTVEYSIKKHDLGFNSEKNKDLVISIIIFIYILLTGNKQGKKDLFRKNIINLLSNKNKNKDEISNKYQREDIFNLIMNIVQMHIFFFKNFFLYFAFSEIFIHDDSDYKKIINEDLAINKIDSFIESYLNKINENISSDFLNFLFISEINNKIKSFFEVENEEEFIIFEENKLYKICDSIYESMNINNFINFIFFAENQIY